MTWLLAFLAVAAVVRLTRFVTDDELAAPFRAWVARRFGGDGRLAYLVTCPWCASVWLAWPVAIAAVLAPTNRVLLVILLALTASLAAGMLARWTGA